MRKWTRLTLLWLSLATVAPAQGLKDALGDKFMVGAAVNVRQSSGRDKKGAALIRQHFDCVVAENCMKSGELHPCEDKWNWKDADRFVQFAQDNGQAVIGHCLVWHSQMPQWMATADRELMRQRMRDHIATVVSRYKGRVRGWDVVNEAINDDGTWRHTPFYDAMGEEYIALAFQYAHEADPEAELYYNDYNMFYPGRRDRVIQLIRDLKARGLRIDGVGMQGHIGMDLPTVEGYEETILAFAAEGVKVMITEMDMSALPFVSRSSNISDTSSYKREMDPYTQGLPDSVSREWNQRMADMFAMFERRSNELSRVTFWGVCDRDSWKNDFPVKGRTDYPLPFDRQYQPKPFVRDILDRL